MIQLSSFAEMISDVLNRLIISGTRFWLLKVALSRFTNGFSKKSPRLNKQLKWNSN